MAESEISIHAHTTGLPELFAFAEQFAADLGLSQADRLRLRLIVEELAVNSIEHGKPPADSMLMLSLEPCEQGLIITYADAARRFDPVAAGLGLKGGKPDVTQRIGGIGWQLIQNWCPDVSYRRADERNELTLRFSCEVPD